MFMRDISNNIQRMSTGMAAETAAEQERADARRQKESEIQANNKKAGMFNQMKDGMEQAVKEGSGKAKGQGRSLPTEILANIKAKAMGEKSNQQELE